jgi:pyruvate dehydrogenase (quinone)
VIVPGDVQEEKAIKSPPREHDTTLSGIGFHRGVIVPSDYDLHAAAEILNHGEKIAMLVGAGALDARSAVRRRRAQ